MYGTSYSIFMHFCMIYNLYIILIFKFLKRESHMNLMMYYENVWKIHCVLAENAPGERGD